MVIITDGHYYICNSVGIYRRTTVVGIYRWKYIWNIQNLKKKAVRWRESFCMRFYRRNPEGFKLGFAYSNVTNSPSEVPTKSPTEEVCRWFLRQKLMYHHSADPLLAYFSFFFPIPTLPSPPKLQTTTPQKKSPFSQHKSYFFKFYDHSIRVLIYYGFYHFL